VLRGFTRARLAAVLALAGVFPGGVLASAAMSNHSVDNHLIVVDRSIGDISIGMSRADVLAKLGDPESSMQITLTGGAVGSLDRFHVHREPFFVTYDKTGLVVAIQTYASFYKTADGSGPNSPLTDVGGNGGFHADFCSYGLWNGTESTPPTDVVTYFLPAGDRISSVQITEAGLSTECASASGEITPPQPPPTGSARLVVSIDPAGGGSVTSSPAGIACPLQCDASFGAGGQINLTPAPTSGFTFDHWSGDCSGSGECIVTMDGARAVTAHFTGHFVPPPPPPSPPPPPPPPPPPTTTGSG
jgi:hypothetical protein